LFYYFFLHIYKFFAYPKLPYTQVRLHIRWSPNSVALFWILYFQTWVMCVHCIIIKMFFFFARSFSIASRRNFAQISCQQLSFFLKLFSVTNVCQGQKLNFIFSYGNIYITEIFLYTKYDSKNFPKDNFSSFHFLSPKC